MRGILFDKLENILSEKQELYCATYLENSWVEQDPADWENALYSIVKYTADNENKNVFTIDTILITSQRSSVIPMDKNLKPLSKAIMWQDKRTNYICEALEDKNDFVFERCGSRVVL